MGLREIQCPCGKFFMQRSSRLAKGQGLHCSRGCCRWGSRVLASANCIGCGSLILGDPSYVAVTRYCGMRCARSSSTKGRSGQVMATAPCDLCGQLMLGPLSQILRKRVCSFVCRNSLVTATKRAAYMRICACGCGVEFFSGGLGTRRARPVFSSRECRVRATAGISVHGVLLTKQEIADLCGVSYPAIHRRVKTGTHLLSLNLNSVGAKRPKRDPPRR